MIGLGEDKGGRFMQVEILGKGWIWISGFHVQSTVEVLSYECSHNLKHRDVLLNL